MNETREQLLFGDRNEKCNTAFKKFGKTKIDLDQDVQIIKEWMKTQKYFPETSSEELLTNMIILNKFSIEKVKQHLSMYYSLRSALPECFCNKNYKLPHMRVAYDVVSFVTLPKLTKEGYRITVFQLATNDTNLFDLFDITAALVHYFEIRMIKDIMLGDISVVDLENITLSHAGKATPMMLKKVLTTTEKIYNSIVKQVHFINAPAYVEGTVTIIKQLVSHKLAERIHVHRSFETLANYIPLELLPINYGGPEYTLQELRQLWQEELVANHQRLDELDRLITYDSERPEPLINDDILGYHGNFKKLNLD